MSWDEAFATNYGEWSADMTADVAFYVELARQADGPLVELAIANGRSRPRARRAGGPDLLPVPRAPAPGDLGRPPPHL